MDKVTKEIKEQISSNKVLLFMKGSPYQPQCGFSAKVAQIMFSYDVEFSYIDVLEFPEVRPYFRELENINVTKFNIV